MPKNFGQHSPQHEGHPLLLAVFKQQLGVIFFPLGQQCYGADGLPHQQSNKRRKPSEGSVQTLKETYETAWSRYANKSFASISFKVEWIWMKSGTQVLLHNF